MIAAVFLDRDGVLIDTRTVGGITRPPDSVADMRVLPGVKLAIDRLRAAGFALVIVTNQPDVSRGLQAREQVEEINRTLDALFRFDAIQVCYHDTADGCACRKPNPGMLLDAARELGLDVAASYIVGDRATDIEAGRRAGCRTVFVTHAGFADTGADCVSPHLLAATDWILSDCANNSLLKTR